MSAQLHISAPTHKAVLLASIAALVVSLALVIWAMANQGHAAFNTSNDGIVWGLPVAVYVFFVLTSTGLTFVASLAMVFGFKGFYPIAKRCVWLAMSTLIAGFVSLAFEIGHPFRMLWAIPASFQLLSPLNWMGVFYALYLVFLVLKFQRMNAGDWDSGASRKLGILAFVTVIVAHGTIGLAFGMMAMRPYWYGTLIPVYFLVTAFLSGIAFAVLFTQLAYGFDEGRMPPALRALMSGPLPKLFAAALGAVIVMVAFRTVTGLWSNADGLEVFHAMVASPWFHVQIWAGLVLPFALLLSAELRAKAGVQLLASVLVIVSLFLGRYEYVIGGQMVPLFKGAWAGDLIEYTPSMTEWMVTLLAISIAFGLQAFGERTLKLEAAAGDAG